MPLLPAGSTIAHLIESDGPGGAERVVVYLVSRLAARGFHNLVLLPDRGEGWLAAQLPQAGVSVMPVPLMGVPLPASYRAVRNALRAARPAVAHSHEFTMAALGAAACWRLGIPHLFTMHGGRYYASRLHRRLALGAAGRTAAAVVAVSQTVAEQLTADLIPAPRRLQLILNGIPDMLEVVPTLRDELRLPAHARLVVAVGNLYPVKGHADLLHAVARAAAAIPAPVHLAIAGRGPEEPALRELALTLGVTDRFHLLGLRHDIANILRSADVFVLSSHSEGLPLALLEAMRASCAIVATAVGQVPIVLDHGEAGVLVPPRDVAAMATAIEGLLTDPDAARARAARASAIGAARYDIEQMVEAYLRLYGEAWTRGSGAPPRPA